MSNSAKYPPFIPTFGNGAPGGNVPRTVPYFDLSTAPVTPYIFNANAWRKYGASSGFINATSLQTIPVDVTAPADKQVLKYNAGSGKYAPSAY